MNPRICTVKDDPPHSYGDCIRACIATILDRDDVPHTFGVGCSPLDSWSILRSWLATIGKTVSLFPTDDHVQLMKENNPGVPYILLHSTIRGDHAVICRDGEKIHDPAWYALDQMKPHSLGFYIIGIVGDLI
jgi:hypothetical protein